MNDPFTGGGRAGKRPVHVGLAEEARAAGDGHLPPEAVGKREERGVETSGGRAWWFRHLDSNQDDSVPRTDGLPITLWRTVVALR